MDFTFLVVEREKTTKKEIQKTSQWPRMNKNTPQTHNSKIKTITELKYPKRMTLIHINTVSIILRHSQLSYKTKAANCTLEN